MFGLGAELALFEGARRRNRADAFSGNSLDAVRLTR